MKYGVITSAIHVHITQFQQNSQTCLELVRVTYATVEKTIHWWCFPL